jgi:hypothetical protein
MLYRSLWTAAESLRSAYGCRDPDAGNPRTWSVLFCFPTSCVSDPVLHLWDACIPAICDGMPHQCHGMRICWPASNLSGQDWVQGTQCSCRAAFATASMAVGCWRCQAGGRRRRASYCLGAHVLCGDSSPPQGSQSRLSTSSASTCTVLLLRALCNSAMCLTGNASHRCCLISSAAFSAFESWLQPSPEMLHLDTPDTWKRWVSERRHIVLAVHISPTYSNKTACPLINSRISRFTQP